MVFRVAVVFVVFIGLLAPIPDTGRWDRRLLCIGKRFVVNAKESTPSDKDGLACSSKQIDYELWVLRNGDRD